MTMKRIKLFSHNMQIMIDGVAANVSPEIWNTIGLDEHVDVVSYDSNLDLGEIEWSPHYITGRKPTNEKFERAKWSAYFDVNVMNRAEAAFNRHMAEAKAVADQAKLAADAKAADEAREIKTKAELEDVKNKAALQEAADAAFARGMAERAAAAQEAKS